MASVALERHTDSEIEVDSEPTDEQQTQQAIDQLPQLVAERDIDQIKQIRRDGDALAAAAKRAGYAAQAQRFGRLMLYAAGAQGSIAMDIQEAVPRGAKSARNREREQLNVLAAAYERGRMEELLNGCGEVLSVSRGNIVATQLGLASVRPQDLRKQLKAVAQRRGTTVHALLVEAGRPNVQKTLAARCDNAIMLEWKTVRTLIEPLGLRVDELEPVRLRRRTGKRHERSKWVTHRYRTGDGSAAKALNQWYAFRDEVRRLNWIEEKPLLGETMKRLSDNIHKGRKPSDEDMHTITDIVVREANAS